MKRYFTGFELWLWGISMGLILLWTLASLQNSSYISVIICFAVFLVNDLYGFISWRKMEQAQLSK